ncbi:hypothetical protein ANO11243_077990 [Dothideomycetidae sp. 11243]|nr:hypothetical protein ANO11243_077990 [fungal sp. No.11243]
MSDDQAPAVSAAFPDPPPYYKHFTKANLGRLRDIVRSANGGAIGEAAPEPNSEAVPDDLRCLVPPEPPADGKYRSFGIHHDLTRLQLNQPDISLEAAGITQIYMSSPQSTDPTPKLLALSRAILLNFLELVGIMSNDPESATEKIEDLQTLFYNAHDLINQYRPHQARESLIMMMEDQLDRSKTEIAAVKESRQKTLDLLKTIKEMGEGQKPATLETAVSTNGADDQSIAQANMTNTKRRAQQSALWAALDAEID